jgi:uncharacterized BrkB/YihY/UPF0761 family membrane protein
MALDHLGQRRCSRFLDRRFYAVLVVCRQFHNRMYGSLGAVVGFQIWLWLTRVIVLFGAEFNAETEHQTALDSTVVPRDRSANAARPWRTQSANLMRRKP